MNPKIQVQVEQIGPSTSKGSARRHTVLVDRPEAKGGADAGPMGGELLLIGLGGCFMSNLLAAIRARTAPVSDVKLSLSGEIDGNPERITSITCTVQANCDDADLMQKLLTIAERSCIAANTLKQAVPISICFETTAKV